MINPFVKALYKYIRLDLWSTNVKNTTKANEPILCQLKCHCENFTVKCPTRWNNKPKMKMSSWYLLTADRPVRTPSMGLNMFLENPLYIEIAYLICQSLEYADNILSRWSYETDRLSHLLKMYYKKPFCACKNAFLDWIWSIYQTLRSYCFVFEVVFWSLGAPSVICLWLCLCWIKQPWQNYSGFQWLWRSDGFSNSGN